MFMILFVLHDPSKLKDILTVWHNAGVSGITILPSTGLKRLSETSLLREDIPLIPTIENLMANEECLNRTLFSIVSNEKMVEKVLKATETITGDLDLPDTGILAVIPLTKVYGLRRNSPSVEEY